MRVQRQGGSEPLGENVPSAVGCRAEPPDVPLVLHVGHVGRIRASARLERLGQADRPELDGICRFAWIHHRFSRHHGHDGDHLPP